MKFKVNESRNNYGNRRNPSSNRNNGFSRRHSLVNEDIFDSRNEFPLDVYQQVNDMCINLKDFQDYLRSFDDESLDDRNVLMELENISASLNELQEALYSFFETGSNLGIE